MRMECLFLPLLCSWFTVTLTARQETTTYLDQQQAQTNTYNQLGLNYGYTAQERGMPYMGSAQDRYPYQQNYNGVPYQPTPVPRDGTRENTGVTFNWARDEVTTFEWGAGNDGQQQQQPTNGIGPLYPSPPNPQATITNVRPPTQHATPMRGTGTDGMAGTARRQQANIDLRVSYDRVPGALNGQTQIVNNAAGPNTAANGNQPSSPPPERLPVQDNALERFSRNLFQTIAPNLQHNNIVYSPASVQILLAMLYIGSTNDTGKELQKSAILPVSRKETGYLFKELLAKQLQSPKAQLAIASKMYNNPNLGDVLPNTKIHVPQYFGADIEPLDFSRPSAAAKKINAWVASKTNNRIPSIVDASMLDSQTQAILVNAVYFKARWQNEFSESDTIQAKFFTSKKRSKNVDMMFNDDQFNFAQLSELNAKAVELPYADTDISMLLLLPNDIDGLADLEQRLANTDLNEVAAKLSRQTVTLKIPKFRIDFDADMVAPLRALGIERIFSSQSEATGFFEQPVSISKMQQKASITVNEGGSEAAATTYAKFVPLSLPVKSNEFFADHPFVFAIRSPDMVLFIGHYVRP